MLTERASLRDRFEVFARTLDGFEDVDVLLKDNDPQGKKRADYLFAGRSIIVEQKTLEIDPKDKPQKFMDRLMEQGRFIAFGRVSTQSIFDKLPDGKKLYRKLIHKITAVIESDVSSADKQTRDTREIFGIPNAAGILVLLNQSAEILEPPLINYRLHQLFKRDEISGGVRYPHNDVVIVISELHPILIGAAKFHRIEIYTNSVTTNRSSALAFANILRQRWAAFNGEPLVQLPSAYYQQHYTFEFHNVP